MRKKILWKLKVKNLNYFILSRKNKLKRFRKKINKYKNKKF